MSPGLMWTTSILFFMYLLSVTVCCDISAGLIRENWFIGYILYGLIICHSRFDISNTPSPVLLCSIVCKTSVYMLHHSDNFMACNTWDTTQSIQKNGAAVSNNENLAQLKITNQYVLPVMLSILLLLWPSVCCTRIQSVCLIDSISIQFVANRLLPANCCWLPTL